MNEWWKHPQKIKFWKKNIDYVMFVDENGSEGKLKYISKQIINNSSINPDDKFFTIDKKYPAPPQNLCKKRYGI